MNIHQCSNCSSSYPIIKPIMPLFLQRHTTTSWSLSSDLNPMKRKTNIPFDFIKYCISHHLFQTRFQQFLSYKMMFPCPSVPALPYLHLMTSVHRPLHSRQCKSPMQVLCPFKCYTQTDILSLSQTYKCLRFCEWTEEAWGGVLTIPLRLLWVNPITPLWLVTKNKKVKLQLQLYVHQCKYLFLPEIQGIVFTRIRDDFNV